MPPIVAWRSKAGGCCCGEVVQVACCPCDIPAEDLTVNYLSTGAAGNGSMTLTYTPGSPPTWVGTCLDLGVVAFKGGSGSGHGWMSFRAYCASGALTFETISWYQVTDTGCTDNPTGGVHFAMSIDSFTCAPFHIHHTVITSPLVAAEGYPATLLYEGGFTSVDLDSATSTTGTCLYKFDISGCNFMAAQGVSISAWTTAAKTTLIGTGTTNSDGKCTIVGTQRATNGHYEITTSRFTPVSGNGLVASATLQNSFNLTEASGYHCLASCAWPEPTTLHATHPVFGAITYTYSAGPWVASVSYSYPGNIGGGGSCTAKTITVTCTWDGWTGYTESWTVDGSGCPDDSGGGGTVTASWDNDSLTCYVPSVSAFSGVFSYTPPGGSSQENLYGVGAIALAIIE